MWRLELCSFQLQARCEWKNRRGEDSERSKIDTDAVALSVAVVGRVEREEDAVGGGVCEEGGSEEDGDGELRSKEHSRCRGVVIG